MAKKKKHETHKCYAEVDEQLKPHNAKLDLSVRFDIQGGSAFISCPECGFCPQHLVRYHPEVNSPIETVEDELDYFECCGCDDGNIMCPECSFEFKGPEVSDG